MRSDYLLLCILIFLTGGCGDTTAPVEKAMTNTAAGTRATSVRTDTVFRTHALAAAADATGTIHSSVSSKAVGEVTPDPRHTGQEAVSTESPAGLGDDTPRTLPSSALVPLGDNTAESHSRLRVGSTLSRDTRVAETRSASVTQKEDPVRGTVRKPRVQPVPESVETGTSMTHRLPSTPEQ